MWLRSARLFIIFTLLLGTFSLLFSSRKVYSQGTGVTLGPWQETAPFSEAGHFSPAFAIGNYFYRYKRATDSLYYAAQQADGTLGAWKTASNGSGGLQGFSVVSTGNSAYAPRNGHILEHVQDPATGDITKINELEEDLNGDTSKPYAFEGIRYIWDTPIYAPIGSKRYIFQLGGFDFATYSYHAKDLWRIELPIQNKSRFTRVNSTMPTDNPEHGAFVGEAGAAYGYAYMINQHDKHVYRMRIEENGSVSGWSDSGAIPGSGKGDFFAISNGTAHSLFLIRGKTMYQANVDFATGNITTWDDAAAPDLPEDQMQLNWASHNIEGMSWGIIGQYVYLMGNSKVFYSKIGGGTIPTATPGGAATATPGTAATATPGTAATATPTTGNGCTLPSIPTNLQPTTVSSAGSRSVTWDQMAGATLYSLRIDDAADGWDASAGCSSVTNNPQDVCVDNLTSPSYPYNFQSGHTYHIWVHAVNSCGASTAAASSVTVGGTTGLCTIQGYKTPAGRGTDVDTIVLSDSQGVSAGQTNAQPYYFHGLTGGQSYTVQAQNGNGELVGSTLCYNRTDCHGVADSSNPDFQAGGSRMVTCPGSGYVDLWWHYAGPGVVPTPAPSGLATVQIKVQDAGGNPVDALTLYTFQCISGVHDCNAINFCERSVVGFRMSQYTKTSVPIGGNICRVGVGAILETGKMQMTSVAMSPVTDALQDQWVPANQNGSLIEHNFGWGGLADGQTYEAVMTVNATPTPTLAAGMCWGVEHCTTGTGGTTYLEYCGNCGLYTTSGCNPSYTCRQPNYTCKPFANTVFYFDEKYPVPCADIGIIPTVGMPTVTPDPNQPTVTPVSAACEDQRVAGDYNCDGSINTNDFKDWLRDFLAGTAELKYLEYWRRALLTATAPVLTPTTAVLTNTPIPGAATATAVPVTVTTPQNSIACPTTSTNTYDAILIESSAYPSGDPTPQNHPDLNLAVRGFTNSTDSLALIDTRPFVDSKTPPQINMMFFPYSGSAQITSVYKAYDWNWDHTNLPNHGTKGSLISNPPVSMAGIAATPGEVLYAPYSDYHIGQNVPNPSQVTDPYQVFLLYADSARVTLKYARGDSVLNGYVVHLEDICVDPNLVGLYNSKGYNTPSNRGTLIALRSKKNAVTGAENVGNPIGVARTNEVKVAVRAGLGSFIDPRSYTWWRNVPL